MDYLRCPMCGKKGVSLRHPPEGDAYQCRYCDCVVWQVAWGPQDERDLDALAKANGTTVNESMATYPGAPSAGKAPIDG